MYRNMCLWIFVLAFTHVSTLDIRIPIRERRTVPSNNTTVDHVKFLQAYGYLPTSTDRNSLHDMTEALRLMQTFYHLPVTGKLDESTKEMMTKPRCGCPDIETKTKNPRLPANHLAYTLGPAWSKRDLTWTVKRYYHDTRRLSEAEQKEAMRRAFAVWQDQTPLRFTYVDGTADLNIDFAARNHGDGVYNSFDGKGNVLAHAFYPPDGNVHFDSEEDWIISSNDGIEMFTVAAHEFGHALGLAHSTVQESLMAPLYAGYDSNFQLHTDDIRGIQKLYGGATVDRTTTQTAPLTTTKKATSKEGCDVRFHAAFRGDDQYLYAFSQHLVYKIGDEGLQDGFPTHIQKIFPGAPHHVDAAIQYERTRQVLLMKGARIWLYDESRREFKLESNYPKYINVEDFPERPSGAVSVTSNSRNYIFGKSRWWEWSWEQQVIIGSDYPMYYRYRDVPDEFDSIVSWKDGFTYIFKGNSYYKIDEYRRYVLDGYPKEIGPSWIQKHCGYAQW